MFKDLKGKYTDRFFIINGFTRDSYITPDGIMYERFDQFLSCWLKKQHNYSRIILIDSCGVYFLDEQSLAQTILPPEKIENKKIKSGLMKRKFKVMSKKDKPENNQENNIINDLNRRYPDFTKNIAEFQSRLKNWMIKPDKKTAVIIHDDSFIDKYNINDESFNYLRSYFSTEFKNLPVENENIIIFTYNKLSLNKLNDIFQKRDWTFWENGSCAEKGGYCSYNYIGMPERDEIFNMLNRLRIYNKVDVDLKNIDKIINIIISMVKQKKMELKALYGIIQNYKEITIEKIRELALSKNCDIFASECSGWQELEALIGMNELKAEVKKFIKGAVKPFIEEDNDMLTARMCGYKYNRGIKNNMFHLALKGNPGTGKTTAAKIISRILQEEGLLANGHLVKATRTDLVAGYVGQTAIKTKEKIDEAYGGVLFIDEAYSLSGGNNDFGKEAIDTLVEAMSDRAGEFVVIFAGYTNDINKLMKSNPGLERRVIQIELPDYNADELANIFETRTKNYDLESDLKDNIRRFCANLLENRSMYGGENFGNAGAIETIVETAAREARSRINKDGVIKISLKDFEPEEQKFFIKKPKSEGNFSIEDEFNGLVGLIDVKNTIKKIEAKLLYEKENSGPDYEQPIAGHYIFKGNPGTGKTTVAKFMANVLNKIGLLPTNRIISRTASDLIGKFVGETENKTKAILESSIGGLLFIDEAHQLYDGGGFGNERSYGLEAIKTIVPFMENHKHDFSLIIAGYPDQIERMLSSDPGLKERFTSIVNFPDYNAEEMVEIFKRFMKPKKLEMEDSVEVITNQKLDELKKCQGDKFANARSVRNFFMKVYENYTMRIHKTKSKEKKIEIKDIECKDNEI